MLVWGVPCGLVFQLVVVGDGIVASIVGALRDGGGAPARLLAVQVRFTDWYEMDHRVTNFGPSSTTYSLRTTFILASCAT